MGFVFQVSLLAATTTMHSNLGQLLKLRAFSKICVWVVVHCELSNRRM